MPYVISINTKYWENNIPGWNAMDAQQQKEAREAEIKRIEDKIRLSENIVCGCWIDPATGKEMEDLKIYPYHP